MLRRKGIGECIRCRPIFFSYTGTSLLPRFLKNENFFDSPDCSGILRFFCADRAESGTKAIEIVDFVLLIIHWIKKLYIF